MCPLPVVPGTTSVQRRIQLASEPPAEGFGVRLDRLLTLIFAVRVRFGPLASEAPVRSRLSPPGVRAPLAEKKASALGSPTEPMGTPGPDPWVTLGAEASRLGPLIW